MPDRTIHVLWRGLNDKVATAQRALGVAKPVEPVETPSEELGHLGFPVFSLAKQLRRDPVEVAEEIARSIAPDELISKATALNGYVNLFLDEDRLGAAVLEEIYKFGDQFAAGGAPSPELLLVEYSSPNTNKPLHLGHIRNNLLGMAISAIAAYHGHRVIRVNLINDRGIHICKAMLAHRKWGMRKTPKDAGVKGDHFVGSLYVRFENELKKEYEEWARVTGLRLSEEEYFNTHSKLGKEARDLLVAWEAGDEETLSLWRTMREWVLDGFRETYERMGCAFDVVEFESDTYRYGKKLVNEGLERGIFRRRPDGAVSLDLASIGMEGEKVLLRPDGTSLYMTQDIGTAVMRVDRFKPDRLIYVVGDEQIYHFRVLFKLLDLLRPGIGSRCHHLAYGMVRLPEGKMKSREGKVVDADDLMDELQELAKEELLTRASEGRAHVEGIDQEALRVRSERIAQAALKFFLFRFSPRTSFEYDPKQSINFNGQTGPYCLYAYARTRSLLRKAEEEISYDPALVPLLRLPSERDIIRQLFFYPQVVARAAALLDPSKVANYVFSLASSFARMFTDKTGYPIVTCQDPDLRRGRLMLANAVGITVRSALSLLGIEVLEEM